VTQRLGGGLLAAGVAPPGVRLPHYDRSAVTAGIVHFGVGGFHRAHQAMVIDDLLNAGLAFDWGICGVGLLPADERMRDVMAEQDGLYTLVAKHADGSRDARVVGSIVQYLFAPDDPEAVIEKLADAATRIVSLTITEGGYNLDQLTDGVSSVFGLVTEAVVRRRARGVPPFAIMSCDNIRGNGQVARNTFVAFAAKRSLDLAEWIYDNIAFPDSMVDRITPVTTEEDRADLGAQFDLDDAWPVVCEPFFQWVLEDRFPGGRPPFERAGVQMVDDVEPYELMKLRLLNASHQGMAYFGYLSGYRYVHEAATDPAFVDFLLSYMDQEATPTLKPVPGIDLDAYKRTLIERFANSEVRDTLARLCAESSDRIPTWLVPVIREQLASGGEVTRSAAIVASWARYAEGVDEAGLPIPVIDRRSAELTALAATQREHPLAFVGDTRLFGDLASDERFADAYLAALRSLFENGAHATVSALAKRSTGRDG
jgi:mannitol 2-dehydrogenase